MPQMSKSSKPVPILIPPDLADKIDQVSTFTGMSKAEIMRLAMRIGLEDLRRCNYDIAGAIVDQAQASGPPGPRKPPSRKPP